MQPHDEQAGTGKLLSLRPAQALYGPHTDGAPVAGPEGEPSAATWVEIAVLQRGAVVQVTHLRPPGDRRLATAAGWALRGVALLAAVAAVTSLEPWAAVVAGAALVGARAVLGRARRRPGFLVGTGRDADLPLAGVAGPWSLVRWTGAGFELLVPPAADASLAERGPWGPLAAGASVRLGSGVRVRADWGGLTFLVAVVASPPRLEGPRRLALAWLALPIVAVLGLLAVAGSAFERPTGVRYVRVHAYPNGWQPPVADGSPR